MVRISAIFISICMLLIAASVGVVVYLRFGFTGAESALVALGALTALAVYNAVAARKRDRAEASNQLANLARGSGDLARQLAEFGRRLSTMEGKVDTVIDRALATAQPLAAEIEELSTLVKQLADSVAVHETSLQTIAARNAAVQNAAPSAAPSGLADSEYRAVVPQTQPAAPLASSQAAPAMAAAPAPVAASERKVAAFAGLDREGIIALIANAVATNTVELYLQPVVTLPQRKVRYYEALSRLRTPNGDLVAAGDFLPYAEAGGLLPKLDALSTLRCVQVVRRLLLKNRDIGLFCNLSGATLTDAGFTKLLEFMDANRAIAPHLVLEFTQSAVRGMGPIENESLAALAERGFRFSIDNLTDLRVDARELNARGFRFVKAPAALLFNRVTAVSTDIHPADFSDLLGRFGIDLIADRIESEATVVDLLDYDVRFGQGLLFSPPRPVRAEALQALGGDAAPAAPPPSASGKASAATPATGGIAQLIRAGMRRS